MQFIECITSGYFVRTRRTDDALRVALHKDQVVQESEHERARERYQSGVVSALKEKFTTGGNIRTCTPVDRSVSDIWKEFIDNSSVLERITRGRRLDAAEEARVWSLFDEEVAADHAELLPYVAAFKERVSAGGGLRVLDTQANTDPMQTEGDNEEKEEDDRAPVEEFASLKIDGEPQGGFSVVD